MPANDVPTPRIHSTNGNPRLFSTNEMKPFGSRCKIRAFFSLFKFKNFSPLHNNQADESCFVVSNIKKAPLLAEKKFTKSAERMSNK